LLAKKMQKPSALVIRQSAACLLRTSPFVIAQWAILSFNQNIQLDLVRALYLLIVAVFTVF